MVTPVADRDGAPRLHGYHALQVARVVQETHDTRSYVLDVPEGLRAAFRYRAGQFCTFRVVVDGEVELRCYSMSSAPETDDALTVTVKRVPGGAVSNWLHDHVGEGDTLDASVPAGVFCVREGDRPVVAFCGGSGVTPVISIAKSVLAATDRPVRVLYANRDARSVIFEDDWRRLAAEYPGRLEVRHHLDTDGGYLDAEAVAGFLGERTDVDAYVCGPTPFMDLVEATLLDRGVDPERIAIERFGSTVPAPGGAGTGAAPGAATGTAGAPGTGAAGPGPGDGDTAGDGDAAGDDAGAVPTEVTLILDGRRHTVKYQPGDTVLETARRASLKAPYSCEAGNCATCMAQLREGGATMRVNNALTPDEVEEGWVLTCQALPEGASVTVEYESY